MKRGGMRLCAAGLALLVPLWLASSAAAGQKQKKKKGEPKEEDVKIQLTDQQAIELAISEMLGAWQLGNTELMHKHYADDVTTVSGAWEPPLVGWAKYLEAYQRQRQRLEGAHLDRQNTLIIVRGNIAWAVYQWNFSAMVDEKPGASRGHTTLILEKRGDRWLIVHNHTSLVPEMPVPAPKPASPPGSGSQAQP